MSACLCACVFTCVLLHVIVWVFLTVCSFRRGSSLIESLRGWIIQGYTAWLPLHETYLQFIYLLTHISFQPYERNMFQRSIKSQSRISNNNRALMVGIKLAFYNLFYVILLIAYWSCWMRRGEGMYGWISYRYQTATVTVFLCDICIFCAAATASFSLIDSKRRVYGFMFLCAVLAAELLSAWFYWKWWITYYVS